MFPWLQADSGEETGDLAPSGTPNPDRNRSAFVSSAMRQCLDQGCGTVVPDWYDASPVSPTRDPPRTLSPAASPSPTRDPSVAPRISSSGAEVPNGSGFDGMRWICEPGSWSEPGMSQGQGRGGSWTLSGGSLTVFPDAKKDYWSVRPAPRWHSPASCRVV